ncbi:peptide/nickel transport system substrate-binding protein [Actinokineospora baliensis]|uniref:ABC transporter substrate-binding protein n=1 Tax=Actinokineospora baliensis TaxID=547056 RepID=UPI001956E68C|nr:ABC transporter substrate-binding protein [Actinokineospora baliensis]MBM7774166.1 peptide/nickel transport system substrate-binding protein [Actinokineospora baliensis]
MRYGGTLTLVGAGDADNLDPALSVHTATRGILRAYTRQLVTYRAGRDQEAAGVVVADMATELPTRENGRLDASGQEYVFTIRPGVRWDDHRPVTATDIARGLKRLAHPDAPSPSLTYFARTIRGLAELRDRLASVDPTEVAKVIECTTLEGIEVIGTDTVVLRTLGHSVDFLNILALPSATPAPIDYCGFLPGSDDVVRRLRSNGPYRVETYVPGKEIQLRRNPAWDPATDPVRAAYLDGISVRMGVSEEESFRLVDSGEVDMLWDIQPMTVELPRLFGDPRLEIHPAGLFSPYLAVNMLSPNENRATSKVGVRRAVSAALDREAVSRVWGGPRLSDLAWRILPPLCSAHTPIAPLPEGAPTGDPDLARSLLADAGYPDGLTLRMVHRDRDIHPESVHEMREALARAGITLKPVPVSINELFTTYFASAEPAVRGDWDLAFTGWEPDWHGDNARTYLQPLFESRPEGSWNLGFYASPRVDRLLAEGRDADDRATANAAYRAVEAEVLRDMAVIPVLFAHQYWFHSAAVRGWEPYPVLNGDLTNAWLAP